MKNKKIFKVGAIGMVVASFVFCLCMFAAPSFLNTNTYDNGKLDAVNSTNNLNTTNSNDSDNNTKNNMLPTSSKEVYESNHEKAGCSQEAYIANALNVIANEEKSKYVNKINANNGMSVNNSNQADVWWKINGTTLEISGASTEGWSSFSSSAENGDFFTKGWWDYRTKIETVNINSNMRNVVLGTTKAWFACVSDVTKETTLLSNIVKINGLDNLNLSKVKNASFMFCGCAKINEVSNLPEMPGVENANSIFTYTTLPEAFLNDAAVKISSATNLEYAFSKCFKLTHFGSSDLQFNAENTSYMFYKSENLSDVSAKDFIDLTKSNVNVNQMFANCTKLQTINVQEGTDWSGLSASANKPFANCSSKLVGGAGSVWASGKDSVTYARVDGGPESDKPGYFTAPTTPSIEFETISNQVVQGSPEQDQEYEFSAAKSSGAGKILYSLDSDSDKFEMVLDQEGMPTINKYRVKAGVSAGAHSLKITAQQADSKKNVIAESEFRFIVLDSSEKCVGWKFYDDSATEHSQIVPGETKDFGDIYGTEAKFSVTNTGVSSVYYGDKHEGLYYPSNERAYDAKITKLPENASEILINVMASYDKEQSYTLEDEHSNKYTFTYPAGSSVKSHCESIDLSKTGLNLDDSIYIYCSDTGDKLSIFELDILCRDTSGYTAKAVIYTDENDVDTNFVFYYDSKDYKKGDIDEYGKVRNTFKVKNTDINSKFAEWLDDSMQPLVRPTSVIFTKGFSNFKSYYEDPEDPESKVTFNSMCAWFVFFSNLTQVTGWENVPDSVQDISFMFAFAMTGGNASFDMSGLKLNKITNAMSMFANAAMAESNTNNKLVKAVKEGKIKTKLSSLNYIQLPDYFCSKGDYKNVSLETMFAGRTNLNIVLGNNFGANVSSANSMFDGCTGMKVLDLRNFNTSSLKVTKKMFNDCQDLKIIIVGDSWNLSNVTNSDDMFDSCDSLEGQQGTNFDNVEERAGRSIYYDEKIDKTFAKVDNYPDGECGYLWNNPPKMHDIKFNIDTGIYYLTDTQENDIDINNVKILDGESFNFKVYTKEGYGKPSVIDGKSTVTPVSEVYTISNINEAHNINITSQKGNFFNIYAPCLDPFTYATTWKVLRTLEYDPENQGTWKEWIESDYNPIDPNTGEKMFSIDTREGEEIIRYNTFVKIGSEIDYADLSLCFYKGGWADGSYKDVNPSVDKVGVLEPGYERFGPCPAG